MFGAQLRSLITQELFTTSFTGCTEGFSQKLLKISWSCFSVTVMGEQISLCCDEAVLTVSNLGPGASHYHRCIYY